MIYRKKIYIHILIIFFIISFLFVILNLYSSSKRIYEYTWDIVLPKEIEEEYNYKNVDHFHGDGVRYSIFTIKQPTNFFSSFYKGKCEMFEHTFNRLLFDNNVPSKYHPNWDLYYWKELNQNENRLLMVLDPNLYQFYILQITM